MSKTRLDYPYVRVWGLIMRSDISYIAAELERARETGAPQDAVYQVCDDEWHTLDDIVNPGAKDALIRGRKELEQ